MIRANAQTIFVVSPRFHIEDEWRKTADGEWYEKSRPELPISETALEKRLKSARQRGCKVTQTHY